MASKDTSRVRAAGLDGSQTATERKRANIRLTISESGNMKSRGRVASSHGKYMLLSERRINDNLRFHYNPGEWDDSFGADYDNAGAAGAPRPVRQYKGGTARLFKMKLLFNELGDKRSGRPERDVESVISWLERKCAPEGQSASGVGKVPDRLLFVPGGIGVYRVVLTNVSVKRVAFDAITKNAVRAFIEIVLEEVWDTAEEAAKAQAATSLKSGGD